MQPSPRYQLRMLKHSTSNIVSVTLLVAAMSASTLASASESIDYVAEHLLEAPMDARYQTFPQAPADLSRSETRLQLGYAHVDAGRLQNDVPLLGLQYFYPWQEKWSLLGGVFWDEYQIGGSHGRDEAAPLYGVTPGLPSSFAVDITDISGSASHYGISLAANYRYDQRWNLQAGVALERLDVHRFRVSFTTVDLQNNFAGQLNYDGAYNMLTPFCAAEWKPNFASKYFTSTLRTLFAFPLPRVGFKGGISGPDFNVSGDTDAAGHGSHIPDPFLGVGFTLEHKASGVRVDLGAPIYSRIYQPVVHKGIKNPLTLGVSLPLG